MKRVSSNLGASLVTVLMIIGAMSALAVTISHSVAGSVARSKVIQYQQQLRTIAAGAEIYSKLGLTKLLTEAQGAISADMEGFSAPLKFPYENGVVSVQFADRTNCFDPNQLVNDEEGILVADPEKVQFLIDLLMAAGIQRYDAEIFSYSLSDWIDSDGLTSLTGAEDAYYSSTHDKIGTADTWLQNASELESVRGLSTEIGELIPHLLCIRPVKPGDTPNSSVNFNTLSEHQLPLLLVAFGKETSLDQLQTALRRRPTGGWEDVDAFLKDANLDQLNPEFLDSGALMKYSEYVGADVRIEFRDQIRVYEYLFKLSPDQPIRTVSRRRVG